MGVTPMLLRCALVTPQGDLVVIPNRTGPYRTEPREVAVPASPRLNFLGRTEQAFRTRCPQVFVQHFDPRWVLRRIMKCRNPRTNSTWRSTPRRLQHRTKLVCRFHSKKFVPLHIAKRWKMIALEGIQTVHIGNPVAHQVKTPTTSVRLPASAYQHLSQRQR